MFLQEHFVKVLTYSCLRFDWVVTCTKIFLYNFKTIRACSDIYRDLRRVFAGKNLNFTVCFNAA